MQRIAHLLLGLAVAAGVDATAVAQDERRGGSPLNLPRPGYEPQPLRSGNTTARLEVEVEGLYDSNVYATSRDALDDLVVNIRPRAEVVNDTANATIRGEAYANVRRHATRTRENWESFGAAGIGEYRVGGGHSIASELRFDRQIQSRADPELRAGVLDRPRKIDATLAQLQYGYAGNRAGVQATVSTQRFDSLDRSESDRDMNIYRASVQGSLDVAAPVRVFAEAYVNRRDFDDRVDLSGVNRDATTYGLLVGGLREITARLRGRLGVGVFRAEPADRSLEPFTGLAASGDITWSPRPRTAVTAQVFRGDVATVRAGASGRTDTSLIVRIDQEARHNLVMSLVGAVRDTTFRGIASPRQTIVSADLQVEYLVNRVASIFGFARVARRSATLPSDEFERTMVGVGVRLRR